MTQEAYSRNRKYSQIPLSVIKDASNGDSEAMSIIQRHYDPYIRRLATVSACGTSYLNTDLYDRLKTRLIIATLKFKI